MAVGPAQTDGTLLRVTGNGSGRPPGMSAGYPRSPTGGLFVWVFSGVVRNLKLLKWVIGYYSQPSCPVVPSAQTDGTLLGPAGRHVRRLSPPARWIPAVDLRLAFTIT